MSEQKNEKPVLVPRLRFPEFREEGEWGYTFGGQAFDQISNREHNSDLPVLAITQEHGAIPRDLIDYHVSVADTSIESYKVVEAGDFIISLRSFQGGIEYSRYTGICSPAYVILRLKPGCSTDYFRQFLKTDRFIVLLNKNLEGLRDGKMVSYKQFSELLLPTPSQEEQQRIADCLFSIDELIAAETKKLDTLKAHKKGLMQQLFPREDEHTPRLRFSEFQEAGEWEEKSIQELIDLNVIIGHSDGNHGELYPRSEEFSDRGIPYISANDFAGGEIDLSKCKYLPESRARLFKKGVAKNGDILFAHNATVGPVAKLEINFDFVVLSTTATYFRCDGRRLLNNFLQFALNCPSFVKQYTRVMKQSTRNQVPISAQRKFKLVFPKLDEQQKIADCLSSLNELIASRSQRINALQAHKKGLLLQLFPALHEVQG